MASIATAVANYLKMDIVIASLAGTRVFDYDVRSVGWDREPSALDPVTGDLRPTLVVAGQDPIRSAFGTNKILPGSLVVYAFAARSQGGRTAVDQLIERVMQLMPGWQDSVTGAVIQVDSFPTGPIADGDDAYLERCSLAVARVVPAINW